MSKWTQGVEISLGRFPRKFRKSQLREYSIGVESTGPVNRLDPGRIRFLSCRVGLILSLSSVFVKKKAETFILKSQLKIAI